VSSARSISSSKKIDFRIEDVEKLLARALGRSFFERRAEIVARDLIGCYLVRKLGRKLIKRRIMETEAYVGPHDLACHAARGRTSRTEPMFGPAGTLYVYLIYGVHWMLNVVTGPVNHPAAVLIRSVDTITGPGRLTKALRITNAQNNLVATAQNGIWFVKDAHLRPLHIVRTKRIGVEYAGPIWASKPYRFVSIANRHTRQS
jgi:DNA-3-methyladenine glycosylase